MRSSEIQEVREKEYPGARHSKERTADEERLSNGGERKIRNVENREVEGLSGIAAYIEEMEFKKEDARWL